jgi:hypothetical protein
MPDPHMATTPTAAALEADAQCRGIGARPTAAVASPVGASPAAAPRIRPDAPVERPIERPIVREAVLLAVAETITHEAHERVERVAHWRRPVVADGVAAPERAFADEGPSPELVRLLGELQSTVSRYTRDRRDAGAAVERVVPEVKGLVREAAACEGWVDPGDTLTAQAVRWAIAAYYDRPQQAHGPCFF